MHRALGAIVRRHYSFPDGRVRFRQFESLPMNADANPGPSPGATDHFCERDRRRQFRIGLLSAVAATITAAIQPVITRYGARSIDPMLFCAGSMTVAAAVLALVMWRRGELSALLAPRWTARLVALS